MGESHYRFLKNYLPGYYRNCELAVLGLFSKDKKIVQKIAQKILSIPEKQRYDPETGFLLVLF